MNYIPLENLLDRTETSSYKLVITAARRALEIAEGQPKMVEAPSTMKPSTVALYEIAAGKVSCKVSKSKE